MYRWLSEFISEKRTPILIVIALVTLGCAATLPFLRFDFTPQQLFETTSSLDDKRDAFAERFGREDNLMVIVAQSKDVYDADVLTWAHQFTMQTRGFEDVKRAESITTLEIPRGGEIGVLTTRPLALQMMSDAGIDAESSEAKITPEIAEGLEKLGRNEPLLSQVVSADGDTLTVLLWIDDALQNAADLERVNKNVKELLERLPPPASVDKVSIGGIPQIRVQVVESLRFEQTLFIPLTAIAYLIILLLLFKRPAGAILPLGTVGIAVCMTVALMVSTDSAINIINNVLPTLIFIIGISDSIHMLTRQAEEIELGLSREDATKAMIRHTGVACLLTSSTTAVGFISLVIADADILKAFGWQAAAGVMFAYIATLFFIPAALTFFKPVVRIAPSEGESASVDLTPSGLDDAPFIERNIVNLAHWVLSRPVTMIIAGVLVTSVFVFFSLRVNIDTKVLEIYAEDHPTYQTTRLLERELGGILPVEVSIEHPERDHFKSPEAYKKLDEFQQFAVTRPGFLSSQSQVDFIQGARAALLADPNQRRQMPAKRAELEQLLLLIEGPPDTKTGVRGFVTSDYKNARVLLRVEDFGARKMLEEGKILQDKLDELFPEDQGYSTVIAGDAYVASVALDSFIRDLLYSLFLAMGIIFGMMTLVFRSFKTGLISVIPNVTPLVATFGYMGMANIDLNTTTIIIFAISLGLAVDDTIHFLARFREEQRRQETAYDALIYTYFGAGRAILLTSVLLVAGLAILLFSSFIPTTYFGKLTGITIFGAVFGDLFLLPPILLLVYRKANDAPKTLGG